MEDHVVIKKANDGSFIISACECDKEGGDEGIMRIKMDEKTYTAKDSNELFEKLKEVLKIDGAAEYDKAFAEEDMEEPEMLDETMPEDMMNETMPDDTMPAEEKPKAEKTEKPAKTEKETPPEGEEEKPMSVGRSAFLASKDKKKKPFGK